MAVRVIDSNMAYTRQRWSTGQIPTRSKIISREIVHVDGEDILPEVSTSYAVHRPRAVKTVVLSSREMDHQAYGVDTIEQQRSKASRQSYAAQGLVQSRAVIISPERLENSKRVVVVKEQAAQELERAYEAISPRVVALEEEGSASRLIVKESGRRASWGKHLMAIARPRSSAVAIRKIERRQVEYVASPPAAVHYIERRSVPTIKVEAISESRSQPQQILISKKVIEESSAAKESAREYIYIPPSNCPQVKSEQRTSYSEQRIIERYEDNAASTKQADSSCCCKNWWMYCLVAAILTALVAAAITVPIIISGTTTTTSAAETTVDMGTNTLTSSSTMNTVLTVSSTGGTTTDTSTTVGSSTAMSTTGGPTTTVGTTAGPTTTTVGTTAGPTTTTVGTTAGPTTTGGPTTVGPGR